MYSVHISPVASSTRETPMAVTTFLVCVNNMIDSDSVALSLLVNVPLKSILDRIGCSGVSSPQPTKSSAKHWVED